MPKGKNGRTGCIKASFLLLLFILLFPTYAFAQESKGIQQWIKDLRNEEPLVRWQAATHLGGAKDARAVEPLIEALGDTDEGVRREVTKALGEIGDPRAAKPLAKMLDDTDEFVRLNALGALENIEGYEATKLLIAALKNDNPMVRMNAAASLGRRGDPQTINSLEEVAGNDAQSYVRFAAQQALVQIRGEQAVKPPEDTEVQTKRITVDENSAPLIAEMERVADRIKEQYGLVLDYKHYDIMDLLDIEARMRMRHPRDSIESVLGDLLTEEDKERNRHLFAPKQ
jgi:HEAT repeat protein